MASPLTSNSFLQTTSAASPNSRTTRPKNQRQPVFAKKAAGPEEDGGGGPTSWPNIRFDFGKWADVKALVPAVMADPSSSPGLSFGIQRRKDPGTVFVAGATGQAGVRIAQTLLRQGFSVRAGVPDLVAAQELARLAANYKIISKEESKRLNAVDSAFNDDAESIAKAIGNASKVVVTIGPTESGPDAQVTTSNALQVIKAAQLAKVSHVAIIYDAYSGVGSTNNVLDGISSFFNNLFARPQSLTVDELLQELVETTDISYTLVKTKLTDDFSPESAYNIIVSPEGAASADNDYKVTRSQIASLVGDVFSNTAVAENKVVEVSTDPSAPSKAFDELFSAIPVDDRRKAYTEALAKAKAEEEAVKASEKASEQEVEKLEQEETRGAPSMASEAQKKAEASVESLLSKAKGVSLSWENLSSQLKSAVQKTSEEPKVRVATVRGQAKARSLPSLKAVVKNPRTGNSKPKAKNVEPKRETRKVFGGLFQQETIYIEDE